MEQTKYDEKQMKEYLKYEPRVRNVRFSEEVRELKYRAEEVSYVIEESGLVEALSKDDNNVGDKK